MSYCRWSDDDFRCDLYCYADAGGGYTTHVASARYPDGGPPRARLRDLLDGKMDKYRLDSEAWRKWADDIAMLPIGLPFDGKSFNDPDLESFLSRVLALKEAGYRVPDYVAESIREEMAGDAA